MGTRLTIEGEASSRSLTVGCEYALDDATTWKNSFDSNGIANVAVSHVLTNPALKINVAGQFDVLGSDLFKANKMGVCISIGDF